MTAYSEDGSLEGTWDRTMLADPSPDIAAFGENQEIIPKNVYMLYNPDNWGETENMPDLSNRQEKLAENIKQAGGTAELSNDSHGKILTTVLKQIGPTTSWN